MKALPEVAILGGRRASSSGKSLKSISIIWHAYNDVS
jgi:hypothetical protein